jgi:leader peptidase (prepilin peptidase)/N-methyltransferase
VSATGFEWYPIVVAFVFGAMIGSFLNVVIHRLPLEQSIVRPGSRCPKCKSDVAWFDNIPLLSYAALRGRCRRCGWRIPVRYPLVELLSAGAAAAIVWRYGLTLQAVWIYAFVAVMMAITFIDWAHQIIPDPLSLGGVVLGWAGAAAGLGVGLLESFIGSVVGGGVIFLIAALYKGIRKVHGMGGGDVKLMAMIGAFLGWQMVFPVLFVAALFGSLYGVYLMRAGGGHGKTAVAFGSFLAPAACLMMFVGERLLYLYLSIGRP